MAMAHKVHTYADLLQQIRTDLRLQHPVWIQANGESPICDSYEARLMELLDASRPVESNDNIALRTASSRSANKVLIGRADQHTGDRSARARF
jgi:hypothetical protein